MGEMRRLRQQLAEKEVLAVLERGTNGILGVIGEDGFPYTVPLSYAWSQGAIYFHCAAEGAKLDAIRACDRVSFTVVDLDRIVPEEYTTYYRSVIVTGRAQIVEEEEERRNAFLALADKYCPETSPESREAVIERSGARARIVKVIPEKMTGKEAIELVREREKADES